MLRSALRPQSLALLALCLGIATVFVLLSRWQLESSAQTRTVHDPGKEVVQPLRETLTPGEVLTADEADQAVEAVGRYVPGSTVLVDGRLQDGRSGWWAVSALQVAGTQGDWSGAEVGTDIAVPVVRGWTDDPARVPDPPHNEDVAVVGRLLPQEAPVPTQGLEPGVVGSLSPAQLGNVWDLPVYSGFVTAAAETPAGRGPLVDDDGTLPDDPVATADGLEPVTVDQQPTDTSPDLLNLFYALEWLVFAGFALWIWLSHVRDDHRRRRDPAAWFELEPESLAYAWDEQARRFYYYDPVAEEYFYFDDPPHDHETSGAAQPARHHSGPRGPQSGEHP